MSTTEDVASQMVANGVGMTKTNQPAAPMKEMVRPPRQCTAQEDRLKESAGSQPVDMTK
jgi:hypothetical protein